MRTLGVRITLQNPVGLYIQQPDFSLYELPPNAPASAQPSDYWKIVRGKPGFGLHAVFEVPKSHGFTVSDIAINGFNIEFGAQIAQTFQIALTGVAVAASDKPSALSCKVRNPKPLPNVLAFRDMNLLLANDRSNSAIRIEQGSTIENIGLFVSSARDGLEALLTGSGVTLKVMKSDPQSDGTLLLTVSLTAAKDAPLGERALALKNPGGATGPAAVGLLDVVPPRTLARAASPVALKAASPQATRAVAPTAAHHANALTDAKSRASRGR